tara:strand:- start:5475 stop:6905 length:1431 start_codon:yes stop_codon:yes gene_type:complete
LTLINNKEVEKVLVGIPTLEEKLNICSLVLEIFSLFPNIHILVIDDNSNDGTLNILAILKKKFPNFNFKIRKSKKGVGSAHLDIFDYAFLNGFKFLITMDADYTHQPLYIKEFIKNKDKADIIVGSRFLEKDGVSDWIIHRKMMTRLGHWLTKYFLGMPEDASGSFRCYNLNRIKPNHLKFVENLGYGFFIETLYIFSLNKYCLKQIPIILPKRTYGESKMRIKDIKNTLLLILKLKFKKKNLIEFCRFKTNDSLVDPQDWDTYWDKQTNSLNLIYSICASIYRKIFIKSRLEYFVKKTYSYDSELLHAGCGTGHVDRFLSGNYNLTAIDISKSAIQNYTANVPRAKSVYHMSIFATDFKNDSFDGIYNMGVMEHFTQQEIINILIEMKRVLKKNGKILLFWPHRYGTSVIFLKAISHLYKIIGKTISFHPKEVSLMKNKKMISNICENTGLKLCTYTFNFRDLFVQTVICLKKDS